MVKVEELELRVKTLESEIADSKNACKVEAQNVSLSQNWDEDFSNAFETFLYERKYAKSIAEKQKEYDILSPYVVVENESSMEA